MKATGCRIERGHLIVELDDGRHVSSAVSRYPRLAAATEEQLGEWKLVGEGVGLRWPSVDEDLSVEGLLRDGEMVVPPRETSLSPSGKYRLTISSRPTRPGAWNYTTGQVSRVSDGALLAEVKRNYSRFPFTWIEDHPSGHAYLVCGEDYQGQTVIELDTGRRRDAMSDGADKGHGFCWSETRFDALHKVLVVSGCIWACPYEYRLYEFSDPMAGWPEIESAGNFDDDKWPVIEADGTVHFYETAEEGDASINTFKREGLKLVHISEWVSEPEKKRRADRIEANRKYEEWKKTFFATDPLYLAFVELVKDPVLSPDDRDSVGITHEGWCPDFKTQERRWCRRIVKSAGNQRYTIDLDWAVATGPIKLQVYRDGKTLESKFFGHSPEAMHEAFAYARALVTLPSA